MRLKPSLQPASTEVNMIYRTTTDTTVALPCEFQSRIATGNATGDRFDSSSKFESTTKLWRLWPWLLQPAEHQVNFLPFSYYRSKGTTSIPRWRRGTTVHHRERHLFVRSQTGKAQVVFFCFPSTTPTTTPISTPRRNRKERQAYSLFL